MREYLIEARKKKGLTQQNVADAVGVSRQYYNMIENGERQQQMDITLATKLAEALEMELIDIVQAETLLRKEV